MYLKLLNDVLIFFIMVKWRQKFFIPYHTQGYDYSDVKAKEQNKITFSTGNVFLSPVCRTMLNIECSKQFFNLVFEFF